MGLSAWNIRYGRVWMLQWQVDGWVSFGVHVDLKTRKVSSGQWAGLTYGPYIDLHLGCLILSLGNRPFLTGELRNQSGAARGGFSVQSNRPLRIGSIRRRFQTFVELVLIVLLSLSLFRTWALLAW